MSQSVIPRIECVEEQEHYGRFVAEPLERGFGVTLGNGLRRILLGHLPGAAITRVKIDGIQHEFSPMPNMREDAIEFILNIKAIRLRPVTDRPGRLTLDMAGEGRVCAADINPSADFEIANPEQYLATMDSSEARLYAEFDVELGTGYLEAESSDSLPLGVIPVDAIFTPIRKVNYKIEPLHIGRETSRERLVLEIWTDGTIEAGEAMSKSAEILIEMLNVFVNYGVVVPPETEKDLVELAISEEQYNMPVEQLALSVRTMNCLRRGNITTVGELISKGERGLMSLRNFGQKSKQEIEERLNDLGLSLNPQLSENEEPVEEEGEDEMTPDAAEVGVVSGQDEALSGETADDQELTQSTGG